MLDLDDAEEAGPRDIVWPLEADANTFLAARLADVRLGQFLSPDDLRAIGLELMRCGPPVGWLGALLVMDSNRGARR